LGNSVVSRIRPRIENEKTYSEILQNNSVKVTIYAYGAAKIDYFKKDFMQIIDETADIYIINYGVVEACNRSISESLYNYVQKKSNNIFEKISLKLINYFENRFRRQLVKLRGYKSWLSENEFKKYYCELITVIKKHTKAKIVCIGINKPSTRIENQLPGSSENINRFNYIINEICLNESSIFIDVYSLIKQNCIPDGVHYNSHGHIELASEIEKKIKYVRKD